MHLPSCPPSPCQVARPRHDPEFGPSTKKRAPRFKFYKKWSPGVRCFNRQPGQSKTWWNAWKTIISQAWIFLVKHNTKNCHSVDFWGQNWIKAFFGKTSASTSLTYYPSKTPPWTFQMIPAWTLRIFKTSWADLVLPRSHCTSLLILLLNPRWLGRGMILGSAAGAWIWRIYIYIMITLFIYVYVDMIRYV